MKKSVLWILVFVIVAFGLLYFGGLVPKQIDRGFKPAQGTPPKVAVPTGNIDEATAAILREVSADEDITPVDSDPTLTSQSDATDSFDKFFNARQL